MATRVESDEKTNTFDPKRAEKLVRDLETIAEEFTSHKMAHMASCKPFHERRSAKLEEAAAFGIPKKIMKAKLNERALRRKLDGVADDFEDDDRETFDQLSQALGALGDTPLGKGAAAMNINDTEAGKRPRGRPRKAPSAQEQDKAEPAGESEASSDDGEPDLRSDAQKLAERDREEEAARVAAENAGKLTDGIKALPH